MPAPGEPPGEPSADTRLGDALQHYYAAAGLPPDGGASLSWVWLRIGGLRVPFPNPPARKRAVAYHDAHHVLTGYDTVFTRGELVIAGFEVGVGCGRFWVAWTINLWMYALGLLLRPRAMFEAFVRGRGCGGLYRLALEPAALERLTVGELRRRMRLDVPPREPGMADRAMFAWFGLAAWAVLALSAGLAAATVAGLWLGLKALLG